MRHIMYYIEEIHGHIILYIFNNKILYIQYMCIVLCDNGTWVKVAHSSSQYESGYYIFFFMYVYRVTEFYIVPSRYNSRFARYMCFIFQWRDAVNIIFRPCDLSPTGNCTVFSSFAVKDLFVFWRRSIRILDSRFNYYYRPWSLFLGLKIYLEIRWPKKLEKKNALIVYENYQEFPKKKINK